MSNLPDGGTEDDMAIKVRTAQQAVRPEADLSAPAQTAVSSTVACPLHRD